MNIMDHSEYHLWRKMRGRCNHPSNPAYHRYGGRGIKVCERWNDSFLNFIADMGPRSKGMQIDRIDVNGNYEPSNCRWVTAKINSRNRRDNNHLMFNGETKCLSDWAEVLGVSYTTLDWRRREGWPVEKILSVEKHHGLQPFQRSKPLPSTRGCKWRIAAHV